MNRVTALERIAVLVLSALVSHADVSSPGAVGNGCPFCMDVTFRDRCFGAFYRALSCARAPRRMFSMA
jgi:hypothetical protein